MGDSSTVGFLASALVHALAMIVLALIVSSPGRGGGPISLVASIDGPAVEEVLSLDTAVLAITPPGTSSWETSLMDETAETPEVSVGDVETEAAEEAAENRMAEAVGLASSDAVDLLAAVGGAGGGLEGRGPGARARRVAAGGGNGASESAVNRGLGWLAVHQRADGAWLFDHRYGACKGLCGNPGTESSTTAATSLALLAFLGAGHTHLEGEHKEVVRQGLYYLGTKAYVSQHGADLQQGTMYAQGISAIALSEAYALTRDPGLKDLAQRSIDFIVYAQDRQGGGWRYAPGDPGDMTVTGWQLMALKSGVMAGLAVPQSSLYLARSFLGTVQSEEGALYGYQDPEPRRSTTAIGLLMRMYTGWGRNMTPLKKGVKYLSEWGPSENDLYYDYYATQVLFHWSGPAWSRWNQRMRDYLVSTQARGGHESGSWYFEHKHSVKGGRLYNTALAVMILEVYYRYLPLYETQAFAE